ncbi:LysR family transcriptional regulator [Pseudonocardia humida]|uniref:LysR family transcriptional regulator n=1 Tax=Pseudonocardia humida TaxID=2800819 RepID=A0ABT1A2G3_9PSEU|nr:LysR family transcriptional regulator [Pseudonocardia humida]MCO1657182.1 LysR family transcriptional regulator [Pseudonocardia humida]
MFSLRQLEYLVTVVDTGSFTRAAALLHVTQPALSHQVRALEQQAGGRLLERLPRTVRATPMGRALLPHARAALADAERARLAARQAVGLDCGELEVATVYSVALGVLPPALRAWHRAHPDVRIRLIEHRHVDELAEAMAGGRADVAIGSVPEGWEGPVRPLGEEEFVLVLPPEDPAAPAGATGGLLDLAELADRRWVHYAPGHGLAEVLDRACAVAGFAPRPAVRTEQTATAPVLAGAGLGPALTPANTVPAGIDGVLRWPDPPITRQLVAYTRGEPDPLTAAFLDTLAAECRPRPAHLVAPRAEPRHPPIRL